MRAYFIQDKRWDDYISLLDSFGFGDVYKILETIGMNAGLQVCTHILDDDCLDEFDNYIMGSNDTSGLADFTTAKDYDFVILWR